MKNHLSLAEYDRLSAQVRAAWVQLNQAGDTPDSRRAILCLQSALSGILGAAAALHGPASLAETVARHHHSFRARRLDAAGILRQLSDRADEIRRAPKAIAENVPDALLVHSAIPVIWGLIRNVRSEVRRLRARPYYARLLRRTALGLLASAAAALALWTAGTVLAWAVRTSSDQGCAVTYHSGEFGPVRGHGAERTLSRDYGRWAPLPWMRRDGWSARWDGVLHVPATADYSFYAQCEGGLRLWLDEALLIDSWESPGWKRGAHAQRTLHQGPHALRMEFRDRGGRSAVRIRWTGGPIPPNAEIGPPYLQKRPAAPPPPPAHLKQSSEGRN